MSFKITSTTTKKRTPDIMREITAPKPQTMGGSFRALTYLT